MSGQETPAAALVTGAAKRIGRRIALDLAAHGWPVAIHYAHSGEAAAETAAAARDWGVTATALQADLGREGEVAELVGRATEALGAPLNLLVNNASVFEYDDVQSCDRGSWDRHLETNLRAPLVLSQGFAAQLPAGWEGNIVNILDQRVWNLTPQFLSYTVAKSGLWTLTRTLAQALAPAIRVNAIGPGPTLKNPRQSDDHFRRQYSATPLQRPSDPDEIPPAVRFILASRAMTGQMIALDSGEHLGWRGAPVAQ